VTPNGKIGKTPTSWSVPLIKPTNAIASCCRARGAWRSTDSARGRLGHFQGLAARALFIAGTHRCANPDTESGCSGTTTACGGGSIPVRISDAPHFTGNFMYAGHSAALQFGPQPNASVALRTSSGSRRRSSPFNSIRSKAYRNRLSLARW